MRKKKNTQDGTPVSEEPYTAQLPIVLEDAHRSNREQVGNGFKGAYDVHGYRMSAPFLTQLATQYDAADVLSKAREDRRKLAQETYAPPRRKRGFWPPVSRKRHDIKV